MFKRLSSDFSHYPRQFWLMFAGMILSALGTTMISPFLMIYTSERLGMPLTTIASLMTIRAVTGLISSIIAGPVVDRLGRKIVMVVGLLGNGLCYFALSGAGSYGAFALILGASGAFSPLYRVGTDAMLADLFVEDKRANAFALMRMARNIGITVGPALGGFVLTQSYRIGLYCAAGALAGYGLMLVLFAHKTLPREAAVEKTTLRVELGAYWQALQDKPFMGLVGAFTLVQMLDSMVLLLLSVYVKSGYGISEGLYGWIRTTNALMVVLFQVLVTRIAMRHAALKTIRWGMLLYIAAALMIAFSAGFWGFWLAMVVLTLGQMIVVPRASALAANLAPVDKRGRYMSLYGLTWNLAAGISPVVGGLLSDRVGVRAPWFGAAVFGLLAVGAFWRLQQRGHGTDDSNF